MVFIFFQAIVFILTLIFIFIYLTGNLNSIFIMSEGLPAHEEEIRTRGTIVVGQILGIGHGNS